MCHSTKVRTNGLASRVRAVARSTAIVAVLCLGLPLALTARIVIVDDELSEVERIVVSTAAGLSVDPPTSQDAPELPRQEGGVELAFYSTQGRRVVGSGPVDGASLVTRAAGGIVTSEGGTWTLALTSGAGVLAAAPVTDGATVVGVVRASSASSAIWGRTLLAWAALALACSFAMAVSLFLATRSAARLGATVDQLRVTAEAIGAGDLSRTAQHSGIREFDDVGKALSATAMRLSDQLRRERALGAATSHQLRTPVMRLQLLLDAAQQRHSSTSDASGRDLVGEAAAEAQNLRAHLEGLLRLSREGASDDNSLNALDLPALLDQVHRRYDAVAGELQRRIVIGLDHDLPAITGSAAAISHALDVLVDNAIQHGEGTVRLWARQTVGTVAIDVSDDGPGFSTYTEAQHDVHASHRGLGLDLARALVEAQGARLILPGPGASSRVTIILSPGPST